MFSQYCDIPVGREMVLILSYNYVLRATVVKQVYSTYSASIVEICYLECIDHPNCSYMGVNIFNRTCFILAAAGGPSRTFYFNQLFAVKQRIVEVLVCSAQEKMKN